MKEIFIIGASEPGYEILDIINEINIRNKEYNFIGFFDEFADGEEIFNSINDISIPAYFISSIGDVFIRERLFRLLLERGFHPETIISPFSYFSPNAKIGKGVLVYPQCSISYYATIEDNVLINFNSSISHGVKIGKNSNICPGVNISGNVNIGKNVFIGIGSKIIEKIDICNSVYIGANSTVVKNINKSGVYYGTPCKYIKGIEDF